MKLRIKDNSLRLRLDQEDMAAFKVAGRVEAATLFGDGARFQYALEASADVDRLTARMEGSRIAIFVPEALAEEWVQTDRVSLEAEQATGEDAALHLLVEKDLGCRHTASGADEEKMFEHLRDEE